MTKHYNSKLLITFLSFFILSCSVSAAVSPRLKSPFRVGFYGRSCPPAEFIVQKYVSKFVRLNPGLAAGLIRLHFHDCFVRLMQFYVNYRDVTLQCCWNGPNSEKESIPNQGSLRGFEVIDAAKAELEIRCPGIVSCADILAFAARDSALKVGNIYWHVPSGRRDGNVSLILDPLLNLPPPFFNASAFRDNFARKGLSLDEMVTLSGAHSIGISHCNSFSNRLYPTVDPTLDPKYAAFLKRICPPPVNGTTLVNPTVNLDSFTPNVLDNKYYLGLKVNKGLLTSDQTLYNSPLTKKIVLNNAQYGYIWARKFAAAMVKMGKIEVLTGTQGEIRRNCHFVN